MLQPNDALSNPTMQHVSYAPMQRHSRCTSFFPSASSRLSSTWRASRPPAAPVHGHLELSSGISRCIAHCCGMQLQNPAWSIRNMQAEAPITSMQSFCCTNESHCVQDMSCHMDDRQTDIQGCLQHIMLKPCKSSNLAQQILREHGQPDQQMLAVCV